MGLTPTPQPPSSALRPHARGTAPGPWRNTPQRTRAAWAVLVVSLGVAAVAGVQWQQRASLNQAVASGAWPRDEGALAAAAPELRFAAAAALAASGADEPAMNRYRALQGDTPLGQAARYNSANLLIVQARRLREGPQPGQAIPLIELAKETYREVLRQDPQHWAARYNLERAQRLLPDPEPNDQPPSGPPEAAERAATTMRGVSQGLP